MVALKGFITFGPLWLFKHVKLLTFSAFKTCKTFALL